MIETALVALGIAVRVAAWVAARSLWSDEAWLSLNILERDYHELLKPLSYDQAAPPAFLTLVKFCTELFGPGERALRLVALIGGIASVLLFHRLARAYLQGRARLIALAFFALAPWLIYYANEVKPYSTDVAVALGLTLLSLRLARHATSLPAAAALAALGMLAPWLSYTSVLLMAGLGVALLWHVRQMRPRALALVSAVGVCWVASAGVLWLAHVRFASESDYLHAYWSSYFLQIPSSGTELRAVYRTLLRPFRMPFSMSDFVGPLLVAASLARGSLRSSGTTRFLLLPVAAALLASAAGVYPYADRLILFLAPVFTLLFADGADTLLRAAHARWPRFRLAATASLIIACSGYALVRWIVYTPTRNEEIRPVLQTVRAQMRPGDALYVYYAALGQFDYYVPRFVDFRGARLLRGRDLHMTPHHYLADAETAFRTSPRVWLIATHNCKRNRIDEQRVVFNAMSVYGRPAGSVHEPEADAYLFVQRPRGQAGPRFVAPRPRFLRGIRPEWNGCAPPHRYR